jgi:hypothetical protein
MGYGMTRAVPMAIIGFVLGAALVVLIRALQSMTEVWNPQLGLTMGGIFATIFFVWGIGGLSGKMAGHHVHEPEEDEFGNEIAVDDHHHEEPTPFSILQEQIWSIAFWVSIVTMVVFFFAALPGGFGHVVSGDSAANTNMIGYFTLELPNGDVLVVSQLLAFILFVAFTMVSLLFTAWLIAQALFSLNRGVKTVKAEGNQPLNVLPEAASAGLLTAGDGGEAAVIAAAAPFNWRKLLIAVVTGLVLYVLFYEALVGWIIKDEPVRTVASVSNAILLPILIFYTKTVLWTVGRVARWTAKVLRALPAFLGQK